MHKKLQVMKLLNFYWRKIMNRWLIILIPGKITKIEKFLWKDKNSLYSIFLNYLKIQHDLNRMSSVIVSQQDLNYNMIYNNVIFNSYTNLLYHYYS